MKLKLLYVHDGNEDITFTNLLYNSGVITEQLNRRKGIASNWFNRHLIYLYMALRAIIGRKKNDIIFIWQQYIAIYYALLSIIYPFNHRPVIVAYIIFNELENRLFNKIKKGLFVFALSKKYFKKIIFFDHTDQLFLKIKGAIHVPYFQVNSQYIEDNIVRPIYDNYFFSGGASNRDYSKITELISNNKNVNVKIACLKKDKPEFFNKQRLVCYHDAYNTKFESLILNSKAVILPLKKKNVLSGQIVILKALQSGKCVFISQNNFLNYWLKPQLTEQFLLQFDSVSDLSKRINQFTLNDFIERGMKARHFYQNNCDPNNLYITLKNLIIDESLMS